MCSRCNILEIGSRMVVTVFDIDQYKKENLLRNVAWKACRFAPILRQAKYSRATHLIMRHGLKIPQYTIP
jgi:hypothetical protein